MSGVAWVLQTDGDQFPASPLFLSPCSDWSATGYLNFNITISNIMSLLKIRVCSFFLFIYNFASAERPAPSTEDIQTYQEEPQYIFSLITISHRPNSGVEKFEALAKSTHTDHNYPRSLAIVLNISTGPETKSTHATH